MRATFGSTCNGVQLRCKRPVLETQMSKYKSEFESFAHLTSELSGAALAASGGGPKGRNVLERLVMQRPKAVY